MLCGSHVKVLFEFILLDIAVIDRLLGLNIV